MTQNKNYVKTQNQYSVYARWDNKMQTVSVKYSTYCQSIHTPTIMQKYKIKQATINKLLENNQLQHQLTMKQ